MVAFVKDREVVFVADLDRIGAENPNAKSVKRAGRDLRRLVVNHPLDALLHFAGGLVRESHSENFRGIDARGHQPRDAGHDGSGLARASTSEDQERPGLVGGGALLLGIEIVKSESAHGSSRSAKRARTRG